MMHSDSPCNLDVHKEGRLKDDKQRREWKQRDWYFEMVGGADAGKGVGRNARAGGVDGHGAGVHVVVPRCEVV